MSPTTTPTDADPRAAAARLVAERDPDWVLQLVDELDRQLAGRDLERVMGTWQLSRAELGGLFGVSRQAVSKWLGDGVPADRAPHVADVLAMTDLLTRYLRRERIPAVVRRPAPRLGGSSLLDLVRSGRSAEALRLTREMFTFSDLHS